MYNSAWRWLEHSRLSILVSVLVSLIHIPGSCGTGISCNTTTECEHLVRKGSECLETGFCSNPFHKGGCLANMLQEYNKNTTKKYVRVCSSGDPPEAKALGHCVSAEEWGHMEIRFLGNNWESIFFETWVVQILLSEILNVPTSVETGYADSRLDFYDAESRMDYGKASDYEGMRTAMEVTDCRLLQQSSSPADDYKSCAHCSLEVWGTQKPHLDELEEGGIIENVMALGVLGQQGLFVPSFAARRDPSIMSWYGLAGEHNRQKLADTFLRPTRWADYCAEVSPNNCSTPDEIAKRAPDSVEEANQMFADGLYIGHFRKTDDNDCVKNPSTCTGHVADYPCGWTSFVKQWAYHLNIAMKSNGDEPYSGGYSYSELTQIWSAANYTKSPVLMYWWQPESLMQKFAGTDAEFERVSFPVPTQKCFENRIDSADRCQPDEGLQIGPPEGVCDEEPHNLWKVLTKNVFEVSTDTTIPEPLHSPAYESIRNFKMSGLQLGVVFEKWLKKGRDPWKYDLREATCEWVVENFDVVQSFIPRTYPRVIQDGKDALKDPIMYGALLISIASLIFVLGVTVAVHQRRHRRVMQVAQVEFLFLLLCGLIMVQISALILALPSSDVTCVFSTWLNNLGYTLELIPLIVKVSAINRLLSAARKMRRIKLERSRLLAIVSFITSLMAVYLTMWTIIDPYTEKKNFEMTARLTEYNEVIVEVLHYCSSDDEVWGLIAMIWRSLLLIWATILAFQTRNCPNAFNESKPLAIMIYSQVVFLIWNLVLYFLEDKLNVSHVGRYRSLIASFDVAAVCCIYFVPKLMLTDEQFALKYDRSSSLRRVSGMSKDLEPRSNNRFSVGSGEVSSIFGTYIHRRTLGGDPVANEHESFNNVNLDNDDGSDASAPVDVPNVKVPTGIDNESDISSSRFSKLEVQNFEVGMPNTTDGLSAKRSVDTNNNFESKELSSSEREDDAVRCRPMLAN